MADIFVADFESEHKRFLDKIDGTIGHGDSKIKWHRVHFVCLCELPWSFISILALDFFSTDEIKRNELVTVIANAVWLMQYKAYFVQAYIVRKGIFIWYLQLVCFICRVSME